MDDRHPADKAYDEVMDEMADEMKRGKITDTHGLVDIAVNKMRARWKKFGDSETN